MRNIKILYACSNNASSKIQLDRFVKVAKNKPYKLKIAAYRKSSPNISIDWTLDCLLNMFDQELVFLKNDNFQIYFEQVKSFNPDLIISDLEYFTSYIANALNIPLWQCSSALLNFALSQEQKYNLGLFKQYYYLLHKMPLKIQRTINMIETSSHSFVCSHLGDTNNIKLKDNFEWIRPYHDIGNKSVICEHNIIASMLQPNKNILNLLKNYNDSVVFTEDINEQYTNISVKDINNIIEYVCNLHNSNLFVCEGQTSFLADAYYNGKFSIIMTNTNDIECIINSMASDNFGYSKTIYSSFDDMSQYISKPIIVNNNSNIKFLHEKIDNFYKKGK